MELFNGLDEIIFLSFSFLPGVKCGQQMVSGLLPPLWLKHHWSFLRIFVIFPLCGIGAAAPVRGSDLRREGVGLLSNQSQPPLGSLGLTARPPAIHKRGAYRSKTKQETSRLWVSGGGRQQEGRSSARKTWWEVISHTAVSPFCFVNSLFLEQPHNCQLENPRVLRAEEVQPTDYVEWQKYVMQNATAVC